jgi:hypothetical protein
VSGGSASVWAFLGDESRWPSGVFRSRELAEGWIGENGLMGMLTEYPLDTGVYDWAVAEGLFRPGKPAHTSTAFIAGFTTAHQNHAHFVDGVAD